MYATRIFPDPQTKPEWDHPPRVLNKIHHPSLTPARFCSTYRDCLTPPVAWCLWFSDLETSRGFLVQLCFPLSSSYLQLSGIWGYSDFSSSLSLSSLSLPLLPSLIHKTET